MAMDERIKITLIKSGIGHDKKIRGTLRGLGLTKHHKTVELENTPAIRGMSLNRPATLSRFLAVISQLLSLSIITMG